jgi:hypothetical protein
MASLIMSPNSMISVRFAPSAMELWIKANMVGPAAMLRSKPIKKPERMKSGMHKEKQNGLS